MNADAGAGAESDRHVVRDSESDDRAQTLRQAAATTDLIQRGLDAHVQVMVPGEWRRRGEVVGEPAK